MSLSFLRKRYLIYTNKKEACENGDNDGCLGNKRRKLNCKVNILQFVMVFNSISVNIKNKNNFISIIK